MSATTEPTSTEMTLLMVARSSKMQGIFGAICNKTDWKAPISCTVSRSLVMDVVDAISFMTATSATVTPLGNDNFEITSIGYRRGPAGDN